MGSRLAKDQPSVGSAENASLKAEVSRLKAELKKANEERDILKKVRHVLCQTVRVKYAFMAEHQAQFCRHSMCRVLLVQRSGHYAWQAKPKPKPKPKRTLADETLLALIKQTVDICHHHGGAGGRSVCRAHVIFGAGDFYLAADADGLCAHCPLGLVAGRLADPQGCAGLCRRLDRAYQRWRCRTGVRLCAGPAPRLRQ